MNFQFHTPCSPQANGRKPVEGDEDFPMLFPTDDGGQVTIVMGRDGMIKVCAIVTQMLNDDPELKNEVIKLCSGD